MTPTDLKRFLGKVDTSGDCWLWTAGKHSRGYGQFYLDGKDVRAHRAAYEHYIGPIPDGLEIDHLCRVRECCNPAHLEAVTHAENVRRGDGGKHQLAKTHCPKGHPYKGDNLYRDSHARRRCLVCKRATGLAYYYRQKAGA